VTRHTIAFPLLGGSGWPGGRIYLKNTLTLIRDRLASGIRAALVMSRAQHEAFGAEFAPLAEAGIIMDDAAASAGHGASRWRALAYGRDAHLETMLIKAGVDVAFEHAVFYGARFRLPVVAWMPDFQHRHMPEMFARAEWWRRDIGFRVQAMTGRTILLSSYSAKSDFERFYSSKPGRAHVVRFATPFDIAAAVSRAVDVARSYGLPPRFFFLPNQFWRHKNHKTVIGALAALKREGRLDALPPVVLTGSPSDPRHPGHFDALMAEVAAAGVQSHFHYLGLIPHDDVLALNAAAGLLINPSFFEGWSTPIEEAKALATPLILSDIPIHREQAPSARFFDPVDAAALAALLLEAAEQAPEPRIAVGARIEAQEARLDEHARALSAVINAAARRNAPLASGAA
jgi:glycosyltransferase involved in cell wall biosynthesis